MGFLGHFWSLCPLMVIPKNVDPPADAHEYVPVVIEMPILCLVRVPAVCGVMSATQCSRVVRNAIAIIDDIGLTGGQAVLFYPGLVQFVRRKGAGSKQDLFLTLNQSNY